MANSTFDAAISKMKAKFGVDVIVSDPDNRPTVNLSAKKYRQKASTRSSRAVTVSTAHAKIEFSEPCDSDALVFEEKVFGGSVTSRTISLPLKRVL